MNRSLLLVAVVVLAGCATNALPSNRQSTVYRGMEGQRQVAAQCPVGYVMACRTMNDQVGSFGMSCSCKRE